MLDIDVIVEPTAVATDIVSRAELKRHIRVVSTALDTLIDEAIEDTVADLDGIGGKLNRTLLPRTYRRWMSNFPGLDEHGEPKPIQIPYGPLIEVVAVTIEDGSSPTSELVEGTDFKVKTGMIVPEIHPISAWPSLQSAVRGVSVTYRAGYTEYPKNLKRLVKIMAAHAIENPESTINEVRQMQINRKVEFGHDYLLNSLKIPNAYDDWNE